MVGSFTDPTAATTASSAMPLQTSGAISLIGWTPSQGIGPRNFAIDPSGKFMLVANQKGGGVAIFKRDIETGALEDTGKRVALQTPMRIVFGTFA